MEEPRRSRARRPKVRVDTGPVSPVDSTEADHPLSIVSRSSALMEPIDPMHRQSMVAEAAYYLAQRRNFDPGHELDDWLAAEESIDSMLLGGRAPDLM